jgi:DNA polymerase-1
MTATLPGNVLPDFVVRPDPTVYLTGRPLFLDFETTNLDKGSARNPLNRIVLACWQRGWDGEVEHKWGGEYEQQELLEAIREADFIVAHNAKFELAWLGRCGLDLETVLVYDTLLAEYVIGGNRYKTHNLSLETCLKRHKLSGKVSLVSRMIKAGICPSEIPQDWLLRYCRVDVSSVVGLMRSQLSTLTSGSGQLPIVYSRCLLTPVLADIEKNGMRLDPQGILPLTQSLELELSSMERQANQLAEGVNLNSPKQLAAYLYDQLGFAEQQVKRGRQWLPDRTPSGGRKTDADTIAALECKTEKQREFKELFEKIREVENQLSKYLRKFSQCIEENKGMLYADFNQTQTYTHRLSSTGQRYRVQFQNQPRAYKKFFMASRDGWLVGEADGAQLEFRAAGHLGRDVAIRRDVVNGVDVHGKTSAKLTEAGQETNRQDAKEHTFKPLYGGESGTQAEQAYYKAFKEWYPGIAAAQKEWVNEVLLKKKLVTEWGMVFYFPDTRLTQSGYITNTPSICNYPVQSFATAEVIPLGLVCMWHRIKRDPRGLLMEIVNTVHDSIAAEFPPEETEAFQELSKQALIYDAEDMVRKLYNIELFVPLGCGVKVGERWGSGKEIKFEKETIH